MKWRTRVFTKPLADGREIPRCHGEYDGDRVLGMRLNWHKRYITLIFGTGFAPFRGGPMHSAKERGPEDVHRRLRDFEQKHGERFAPNEHWQAVFGDS